MHKMEVWTRSSLKTPLLQESALFFSQAAPWLSSGCFHALAVSCVRYVTQVSIQSWK